MNPVIATAEHVLFLMVNVSSFVSHRAELLLICCCTKPGGSGPSVPPPALDEKIEGVAEDLGVRYSRSSRGFR